ncbi:hypothetical protein E2C01_075807 [Portunus trituberculatus]|uniref:Uncharacterized protein n=1 Tax=Portunus trituberculatus TaxID=210409 RepID=A0A5B7I9M7_PORTR|nr:hypothetical protein [Portunus trituberculatus]
MSATWNTRGGQGNGDLGKERSPCKHSACLTAPPPPPPPHAALHNAKKARWCTEKKKKKKKKNKNKNKNKNKKKKKKKETKKSMMMKR